MRSNAQTGAITRSGVVGNTSGDKPVDNVDNSVTAEGVSPPYSGITDPAPAQQSGNTDPFSYGLKGSDLAKMALAQARAATQAKRQAARAAAADAPVKARRRRKWSGSHSDERDPQQLGRLAAKLVADRGWSDKLSAGAVFNDWAKLVGAEVAEHTTPLSLKDGELTVQASSTAWATQLRLLQRQLITQIGVSIGADVVKRLRVQGPVAPSWRHGPRHVLGRGPRDTYG